MKYAIVDFRTSKEEIENLKKLNLEVILCPPCKNLYEAVCGHPDMQLNIISDNEIIVHRGIDIAFIEKLIKRNIKVYKSENFIKSSYPEDIILNAVNLKSLFIHKLKNTDKNLMELIKHKKLLNVSQGYTKCSTAILSEEAIITSDRNIAKVLLKENIDVLLLPPGDILLPGLDYGFIGGCCGLINENTLCFFGNLNHYKYGDIVINFLKKYKINPIYLREDKLIDRGSLLII